MSIHYTNGPWEVSSLDVSDLSIQLLQNETITVYLRVHKMVNTKY